MFHFVYLGPVCNCAPFICGPHQRFLEHCWWVQWKIVRFYQVVHKWVGPKIHRGLPFRYTIAFFKLKKKKNHLKRVVRKLKQEPLGIWKPTNIKLEAVSDSWGMKKLKNKERKESLQRAIKCKETSMLKNLKKRKERGNQNRILKPN